MGSRRQIKNNICKKYKEPWHEGRGVGGYESPRVSHRPLTAPDRLNHKVHNPIRPHATGDSWLLGRLRSHRRRGELAFAASRASTPYSLSRRPPGCSWRRGAPRKRLRHRYSELKLHR